VLPPQKVPPRGIAPPPPPRPSLVGPLPKSEKRNIQYFEIVFTWVKFLQPKIGYVWQPGDAPHVKNVVTDKSAQG